MEANNQKGSFLSYEANAWFERNKSVIENYSLERDRVVTLIKEYDLKAESILEIGCSAGYRLNAIKSIFADSEVFGVEPSEKAIEYGESHFPSVNFIHGTADNLEQFDKESLDIVIVGFVFYVIDRNILLKVVAEIDRVLRNGGILIIVDFFSENSLKNVYEHIQEFTAFSFKQNYDEVFTASKLYYLLDKSTWNHSEKKLDASNNYYDKYSISLLKKDIESSYK
ncbi:class I SAM-dependent methyltransferase [Flavobacterium sp. GN10]|uniref:Class I SAM-dependent methyltransferase n=1 Tax=Flavobacterium tagetis TaxID=2801336 RepID=A0ABS1KH98_9FLAO|nr:class I SAM-dependent methyltransferase [Flavobacterium tagetis]MBL0738849.1 class I SAM-dependent methyltransferase [Flavobacterium tagetis]